MRLRLRVRVRVRVRMGACVGVDLHSHGARRLECITYGAGVVLKKTNASSLPMLPLRDILRKPIALLKAADDNG